jgi:hypothetical protein
LPRPYRIVLWIAPFLVLNGVLIAVLNPDGGRGIQETLSIGFFFGSLFAHTTLASAWTALGPAPLVWRLPLSLIWVFSLAVAIQANLLINGGPEAGAIVVGACLFVQWLLMQVPLWTIAVAFGAHLRHTDNLQTAIDPREYQFGIRQLIIVTTIVAIVFGCGRLVVPQLAEHVRFTRGEAPIFIFLGAAAVVLTLPLLLAALMRRYSTPGVLVVLVLIGFATACEMPLLRLLGGGTGPKTEDFVAINAFTAAIMLIVLSMVRLNGYSLAISGLPAKG